MIAEVVILQGNTSKSAPWSYNSIQKYSNASNVQPELDPELGPVSRWNWAFAIMRRSPTAQLASLMLRSLYSSVARAVRSADRVAHRVPDRQWRKALCRNGSSAALDVTRDTWVGMMGREAIRRCEVEAGPVATDTTTTGAMNEAGEGGCRSANHHDRTKQ